MAANRPTLNARNAATPCNSNTVSGLSGPVPRRWLTPIPAMTSIAIKMRTRACSCSLSGRALRRSRKALNPSQSLSNAISPMSKGRCAPPSPRYKQLSYLAGKSSDL